MSTRLAVLVETLENAAVAAFEDSASAGATEIRKFLRRHGGSAPNLFRRLPIAVGALIGYTHWRASENEMVGRMLMAAGRTDVHEILEIAKAAVLTPEDVEKYVAKRVYDQSSPTPTLASKSRANNQVVVPAVLREADAARYIGLSRAYLKKSRIFGRGPAFIRVQRTIAYRISDLDAWLESNIVRPS